VNPDEEPTGGAQDAPSPASAPAESIECRITDGFADWLRGCGGSLAMTTYQAGKVVLLGWQGNQVHVLLRHFPRPMGLAVAPGQLALAARDDLNLFADAPLLAPQYLEPNRYDALFLPRVSVHTGRLNLHDMAFLEPDPADAQTDDRLRMISICVDAEDRKSWMQFQNRQGKVNYGDRRGIFDFYADHKWWQACQVSSEIPYSDAYGVGNKGELFLVAPNGRFLEVRILLKDVRKSIMNALTRGS
jgi:hypothetical protein